MRPIALLIVCLCSITNAAADYWVSVGSFVDAASAERVRDAANRAGSIRFGVTGTETGKGYYYRVVSGPYTTYDEATRESSVAAASGYDKAWIFTQPSGAFSVPTTLCVGEPSALSREPAERAMWWLVYTFARATTARTVTG